MLSIHTVVLLFAKSARSSIKLDFAEDLLSMKQSRFKDRTVFQPIIDLSDYVFHAVIDWIDVHFFFARNTQHQWIQKHLVQCLGRKSWIDAVKAGPGNTSGQFVIRFQEPESIAQVQKACDAISSKFGELHPPAVAAIEVSVDAYPRLATADARSLLLGVMQKTYFTKQNVFEQAGSRPRYSIEREMAPTFLFPDPEGAKGFSGSHVWCWSQADRTPPVDGTLSVGRKGGPAMVKLMDKVVDRQNVETEIRQELTEENRRTRIEVTLNHEVLREFGVCAIKDLSGFSFGKLQGNFFQFMLPTFSAPSAGEAKFRIQATQEFERRRREKFLSTGILGLQAFDHGWRAVQEFYRKDLHRLLREEKSRVKPKRRGTGQMMTYLSYEDLSGRVATALRQLSGREERAWSKMRDVTRVGVVEGAGSAGGKHLLTSY